MSQFSNCLSIGKESVLWVLVNLLLQLLYHGLHDCSVQNPHPQASQFSALPLLGVHLGCALLHILASEALKL